MRAAGQQNAVTACGEFCIRSLARKQYARRSARKACMRASEHKKDSRTAARNLTARKDEQGRSLRNGAPTPILTARKDGHLFANFAGLPGRPCAGPKRQCIAQQHMHQGVIPCNGVAPCGESPPVCRPITAREGFKIRTSYFVAAPERKPGNRP